METHAELELELELELEPDSTEVAPHDNMYSNIIEVW